MCQSKAEGGRRCQGTPSGKALYALYRQRKSASSESEKEDLSRKIESIREAVGFYGVSFVSPYEIEMDEHVMGLVNVINEHGNALVVGGCVRDSLTNAENKDMDIEVHGMDVDDISKELKAHGYHVDEVGKSFGVLKVKGRGVKDVDVSVPRTENKVGAGHRDFDVQTDSHMGVVEAASRRDFTFNAMMFDPKRKMLIDPYCGREDFENGRIRAVSSKFSEDPLRVLRAFQFSGRFGMVVDESTAKASKALRGQYSTLPVERVREEWGKFYSKTKHPDKAVKALQACGWDDTISGLRNSLSNPKTVSSLSTLSSRPRQYRDILGAAVVSREMGEDDRRDFTNQTLVGSQKQKQARMLAATSGDDLGDAFSRKMFARKLAASGINFEVYSHYAEMIGDKEGVSAATSAKSEGVWTSPEPDLINGEDVIRAQPDRKAGPWVKALLDDMRERQYRGEFKSRDDALTSLPSD